MIEWLAEYLEYVVTFIAGMAIGITAEYMIVFNRADVCDPEDYEWVCDEYRGKGGKHD